MTRQNRVNSRRSSGPVTPFQTQPSSDFVFSGLPLEHASKTQGCHGTGRPSGPKRPNGLKGKDRPKQDRPNQEPNQDQEPTEPRPTEPRAEPRPRTDRTKTDRTKTDRTEPKRFALHLRCGFARPAPAPSPPARYSLRLRLGRAGQNLRLRLGTPFASGSVAFGTFASGSMLPSPPARSRRSAPLARCSLRLRLGRAVRHLRLLRRLGTSGFGGPRC